MNERTRTLMGWGVAALLFLPGCQSPTASDSIDVDDVVEVTVSPSRATAVASTDGRTYRVVRGNNQPDDILPYDWVTSFSITVKLNSNATNKDVDLEFPVSISSVSGRVQQASGGIVTPPTGGDVEHYDSVIAQSTGNVIAAVNGTVTMTFQVWYDLPNLRKEALITESINFQDSDGRTFTKAVDVVVDP